MKLAQADIFGTIAPPTGAPTDLGNFTGGAIRIFIIVAGFALLIYLFWGAFDWITSEGDKEKVGKARNKIINAIIGVVILAAAFAIIQVLGVFTGFSFFVGQKDGT